MTLIPVCNYEGKDDGTISFYKMDSLFLETMSSADLDSIIYKFTPQQKSSEKEYQPLASFSFKNFSKKQVRLFKENATCFKERYARKVKSPK